MQQSFDLDHMQTAEKFQMLEQIWDNLSHDANDKGFTPSWHLDVLSDRESKVEMNELSFHDISDVKKRLKS
jgi:hypothetical protein